ncbi:hypothetical protein HDF17_001806 [Granulicella arctica]|uniref:Uncharacterized protein n=1 Tax=Granulicella arctica TaxID=940613 RepID=A0A7Y9PGL2_9BACT|nr:hypothetical protein [Granulicella arctica]
MIDGGGNVGLFGGVRSHRTKGYLYRRGAAQSSRKCAATGRSFASPRMDI